MSHTNQQHPWIGRIVVIVAYLAMLGAVAWGMDYGRRSALNIYQSDVAQQDWDEWRKDASGQSGTVGPVARRAPESHEPPALVLMRDYFWQCLIAAWLVTSALGFSLLFFVRGMLTSPTWQPLEDPVHPAIKKPGS